MKKLFLFAIVVLGFASASFAQQGVNAFAPSSATIITPITIVKTTNLNFGNIAVNNVAGTVELTTLSGRNVTGGVTLPVLSGTVSAAQFTVSGLGGSTYSIGLPPSAITLSDGNSHTMSVGSFVSDPTPTGTLSVGGSQVINIGATLTVGASQVAGTYTNATDLVVSVNYN